ncbi:hypothetical protein GCM10009817_02270 [Terrabacter lapilli]|uniref:Glycosyl transferase family 4 n=1 Tax=Terrabacter lapilli TaxID=436231 RepID=A0ABN2RA39_9MICO
MLAACLLVALVGFLDDRFTLSVTPRLLAQMSLGVLAGWATGMPLLGLVGAVLFPVVVNAINFMDGINGITGMVTFAWGTTAAFLGQRAGAHDLRLIGLVTAGAALGFLPFNAPYARLFLGDVGSYLFGSLCAAGILLGIARGVPVAPLVAPLGLYLVDVFWTLARRLRARESLTTAHRDHIYQRLVSRGLEHMQVSAIVLLLSCVITACWVFLPAGSASACTAAAISTYVLLPPVTKRLVSSRM